MPPPNILNAPTRLMKDLGYGAGYSYDHDHDDGFSGANYWPDGMAARTFYVPADRGFEARIAERIAHWNRLRKERG
jgi:putative ATPase